MVKSGVLLWCRIGPLYILYNIQLATYYVVLAGLPAVLANGEDDVSSNTNPKPY